MQYLNHIINIFNSMSSITVEAVFIAVEENSEFVRLQCNQYIMLCCIILVSFHELKLSQIQIISEK